MPTCLVSLVSDQTIPNILAALHFNPDLLLFISTNAMENKGKSQAILNTLQMRGLDYSLRAHTLKVDENSIIDLQSKVTHWLENFPDEINFIVNLTCGTKIMSIAAYDLFSDFGSTMIYLPIPKNEYLIPFPKRRPREPVPIPNRLTVAEYLAAYGIDIINTKHLTRQQESANNRQHLTKFIYQQYRDVFRLLKYLGRHIRPLDFRSSKKIYDFSTKFEINNEAERFVLQEMGFSIENNNISKMLDKDCCNYLKGGWLEERLFLAVQKALPQATDIQLGVMVQDHKKNKNEFDVLFTLDNVLYNLECKSLGAAEGGEDSKGPEITDFLYKHGALRQQFGLTPKVFLATTAEAIYEKDGQIKPQLIERASQFQCEIIPLLQINDLEGYFANKFSEVPKQ
ncbi:Card1-like endonuclease domain-containing protein [Desulfobacca acetoxidans]